MEYNDPLTTLIVRVRGIVRQAWRDLVSVYCANTPVWRWLKSGALVFLGFFLWAGANALLSYRPEWWGLRYVMAYGFVVLAWGPLTHFVVVPLLIRLRRSADSSVPRGLLRHGSKLNFTVFLTIVVLVGTFAPGVMTLDFSGGLVGEDSDDVTGSVDCEYGDEVVACHVEASGDVDHVAVTSGGEQLRTLDAPPYKFELERGDLADSTTGKQFVVELRDEDGDTLRRFVRTVPE